MSQTAPPPGQPHTAENLVPPPLRRFVPLLAVVAISVATVGYLTGLREPRQPDRPQPPAVAPDSRAPAAVNYAELAEGSLNPGTAQSLAQLQFERPGPFDPVTRTEEMKLAALADRSRNRAYDGAPPTIPHPVDFRSAASCLACHGEGIKVGDRVASKISHAHLSNCTQCHVEQAPSGPLAAGEAPENSFAGVYRAGAGQRASPGAPPTIPHHTWMRESCLSCHGPVTRPGTRTTHPWLTSCTQCHAPSAALDQFDFTGGKQ